MYTETSVKQTLKSCMKPDVSHPSTKTKGVIHHFHMRILTLKYVQINEPWQISDFSVDSPMNIVYIVLRTILLNNLIK